MAEEPKTGLDAIRKRFEAGGAPIMGVKPNVAPKLTNTPKPNIAAKFGGGVGNTSACNGTVNKDTGKESQSKGSSAIVDNKTDSSSKDEESPANRGWSGAKRNSKVNIPDAFLNNTDNSPKVKTPLKPVPPTKPKSDNNNNASNSPTPGKFDHLGKVRFENKVVDSESSNSTQASKDGDHKPGLAHKTNASRSGSVLAMAGVLETNGPIDFKARLKPVNPKPTTPLKKPNESSSDSVQVELRNKQNKFGVRTSNKRKSVQSVIRNIDGKKFHRIDAKQLDDSSKAPEKPESLDEDIDLEALNEDFHQALKTIGKLFKQCKS